MHEGASLNEKHEAIVYGPAGPLAQHLKGTTEANQKPRDPDKPME